MRSALLVPVVMLLLAAPLRARQAASTDQASAGAGEDKPLPPIKQLLEDVERNVNAGEAARNNYTYHVHIVQQEFSGNGQVKKTTVEDRESLTISGVRVDRLVARDGKPLDDKETRKESERIDKVVAKDKEHRDKLKAEGKSANDNGQAVMPASRFLELGTFSTERRVVLDGRSTIALDYAGDPNAKTKTEFEGVVRDLVGTIWVDEAEHVLVKAEGHFLQDFKIGGGLVVNIHQGFRFSMRTRKINDEVWLPVEIDANGSARVFLFDKIEGSFEMQTSDYRKFRTSSTIVSGDKAVGPDGQPLPESTPATPPAEPPIAPQQ